MLPLLDNHAGIVPATQVLIGGLRLSPAAAQDLLSVVVYQDVEAPGMFVLRLVNWDPAQLKITWSDDPLFAVGNAVEVRLGYVDNLDTLLVGEITGLEPEFRDGEIPTLVVRGYDLRHRLLHGRKTRSFTQLKDSDIASRIAGERGLAAQAADSGVTLDYVLQHNQTDLEFLQERARRIGYEVVVADRTLYFRPHQNTQQATLTLKRDIDLLEFRPRLSTLRQAGQTSVSAWSVQDKAAIVAQATPGDLGTMMGGRISGPAASDQAFGASVAVQVSDPVSNQAEADQLAKGWLKDMALSYITGEGISIGRTDLRAGTVVNIDGVGQRFSGLYYVTSATHTYSPRQGYRIAFSVKRSAS